MKISTQDINCIYVYLHI